MDGSEQQKAASKTPRRRGRGKPFEPGDPRINRHGVPGETVALAKLLRETGIEVALSPSPRCPDKTRLVCIYVALADKAERGDVRAAEVLFERIGGKPTQPIEADVTERGRITFEWSFEPPSWAPKHVLDEYEAKRKEKYGEPPALLEASEPQAIEGQPPGATQPEERPAFSPNSVVDLAHHDDSLLAYAKSSRN